MSNLEDPANRLLTEDEPTTPDGGSVGSAQDGPAQADTGSQANTQAESQASATNDVPTAARLVENGRTPASAPEPSAASLLGLPDELPLTWCPRCAADVKPKGRGQCPRCGRVLKGAFLSRKYPVDRLRRQQLLDKFVLDYQPRTQRLQSMCEQYAGVVEQLETLKPGSQEHKRLVELAQLLGDALEAARPAQKDEGLKALTPEQLEERALRLVEMARSLKRSDLQRAPRLPDVVGGGLVEPGDPGYEEQDAVHPSASTAAPAPALCCEYCHQTLARCAEIKETRLDDWRALHHNDPAEVARRDEEATAVMMRMVGKGHPNY